MIDEGAVPSTTYSGEGGCTTGCRESYPVDGLEFGYCTATGLPVEVNLVFWDPPVPGCINPFEIGTRPAFALSLTNLPRSSGPGVQACYIVNVVASGQPGLGFQAEIGGSSSQSQLFKWSIQMPGTTGLDGPMRAGSHTTPLPGCGWRCASTIWEVPVPTTNPGTGFGTGNEFIIEDFGGTCGGCYSFSGPPLASFYLKLFSIDACGDLGTPFCDGTDGSFAFCPCGNAGQPDAGCDNAASTGGVKAEVTVLETSNQEATIVGSGFPSATTPAAILMRANNTEPTPVTFGDGLRCVGLQGLVRMAATLASGGTSTHTISHGAGPGAFHYQIWYRSNPASYCTLSAFNLSSGRSINW